VQLLFKATFLILCCFCARVFLLPRIDFANNLILDVYDPGLVIRALYTKMNKKVGFAWFSVFRCHGTSTRVDIGGQGEL